MTEALLGVQRVSHQLVVVASERVLTEDVEAVVRAHAGEDIEGTASAEAAQRADQAADTISTGAGSHAGDIDPLQAVEDALRLHVADELVLITAPCEETSWNESDLEEWVRGKFGLPITHLVTGSHRQS